MTLSGNPENSSDKKTVRKHRHKQDGHALRLGDSKQCGK